MTIIADLRRSIDAVNSDDGVDPNDAVEALISTHGWDAVCDGLMKILADDSQEEYWRGAMDAFWCAGIDKRPVPADRLIALLHHRFDPEGTREDNLVWSIASTLKKVGYLSDYRPLEDPSVAHELAAIRSLPNTSPERTREV
jgi:hypothetical protein